jgi:16S rRNA G527 N7-methylase RsmG
MARFEEIADRQASVADCVTVRAVRTDKALFDTTLRLLRPSGRLVLFGTAEQEPELPGFKLVQVVPVLATGSVVRVSVPRGTND